MNTVLGWIGERSMLIAGETSFIVRDLVFVIDNYCSRSYVVTADWHIKFDARKWLLLPDTAVLEDVRDFVKAVAAARKDSSLGPIPTFQSKVILQSQWRHSRTALNASCSGV